MVVVVVLQPAVFKVANHDVDLGAFDGLGDEGKVPEVGGGGRGLLGGGRVLDGGVLLVLLALGGEGRRRGRGGGRGREATRLMRVHCGGCVGVVVCVWFWLLVSSPLVFSPWLRERMVSIGSLGGVCVFCSVRTTYESVFALVCRWWSPDQQRGEGSSGRVSRVVVGAQRVGGGREDDDRDVCGGGRPGMLAVAGVDVGSSRVGWWQSKYWWEAGIKNGVKVREAEEDSGGRVVRVGRWEMEREKWWVGTSVNIEKNKAEGGATGCRDWRDWPSNSEGRWGP